MDEWNKVFVPILGKESTEYCEELAVLLLSVDQSVKPCFMWDHSSVDSKSLFNLLQTLHSKRIISNPLAVVEVDLDVFIVNVDTLARVLIGYLTSSHTWMIDISKTEPRVAAAPVHDTFKRYLCTILRQLGVAGDVMPQKEGIHANDPCNNANHSNIGDAAESSSTQNNQTPDNQIRSSQANNIYSNNCSGASDSNSSNMKCLNSVAGSSEQTPRLIALSLPEEANLSTIFGCLLGYPQIYWWDGQSSGSSLSGMPLKVYKFTVQCSAVPLDVEDTDDSEEAAGVEVFSFSIPEVLESELRAAIQVWANIVHTRVEQAALFSLAKLNCDPVLCLDVAL